MAVVAIYELVVRRSGPIRVLLGLRPRRATALANPRRWVGARRGRESRVTTAVSAGTSTGRLSTAPKAPRLPTLRIEPMDPTLPIEATLPAEPMLASDPAEPTDATEPAEPMEAIEPALPMEATDPALPIEMIDPALPIEATDPALPTASAEPGLPFSLTVSPDREDVMRRSSSVPPVAGREATPRSRRCATLAPCHS